jgi:hypothetical protein
MKTINKNLFTIFVLISVSVQGQEFSESDVGFNANLLDLGGINCLDSFNESSKKKWKSSRPYKNFQVGKNIRSGSLIFFW